jgi:hypothetical protein
MKKKRYVFISSTGNNQKLNFLYCSILTFQAILVSVSVYIVLYFTVAHTTAVGLDPVYTAFLFVRQEFDSLES